MNNNKEAFDILVKKITEIEKEIEKIKKKQETLQDAFYKLYEDQRRRERKL